MRELDIVKGNKAIFEEAFEKWGDSPKSCLWDEKMVFRYEELTKIGDLNGAEILDIGCGIGGFYEYCVQDKAISDIKYKGIDLVEGMIELARSKYPEVEFETSNILEKKIDKSYDYIIFCGVFNVCMDDEYMMRMLSEAFEHCKKGMAFNFISAYVNFREQEMAYHDPVKVLQFCIEKLSPKVRINHHYNKCDVSVFVYK